MLRVTLLGNMGGDPEIRWSQKGTQIASFSVAVNQVRTGADGERQENTEWFRVRVANRQLEYVQRLSKGTRVLVLGRLDISHFQGRDGEPRTGFDVWADDVQAMSTRGPSSEPDSMAEGEAEALEPAAAGVSSLAGAGPGRAGTNGNGKGGRAAATRPDPPGRAGGSAGEDLEDLPF
jgi:single-strand DNA-binding protein